MFEQVFPPPYHIFSIFHKPHTKVLESDNKIHPSMPKGFGHLTHHQKVASCFTCLLMKLSAVSWLCTSVGLCDLALTTSTKILEQIWVWKDTAWLWHGYGHGTNVMARHGLCCTLEQIYSSAACLPNFKNPTSGHVTERTGLRDPVSLFHYLQQEAHKKICRAG